MFRGTLTLLARSIRLDARLRRAHAFRVISIAMVFWLLVAAHIGTGGVGAPGLAFYQLICLLCFGLISVAGAGLFSSAITEEKEAGTLNLLLLAGVSPAAILVGKSTTRLVSSLLLFAGIFPFTLLALALGGVTVHQIWSGFLALAAYLVFVANVGVLSSVLCRSTGRASVMTTLVLFLLFSGPLLGPSLIATLVRTQLISTGGSAAGRLQGLTAALTTISPVHRLDAILQTGFASPAWSGQVTAHLLLGLGCFVAAWIAFPIFCERMSEDVPRRAGVIRVRSGRWGLSRLLTPRPWRNALLWKDFHFMVGGIPALALRMILIPVAILLLKRSAELLRLGLDLTPEETLQLGLLLFASLELISISTRIFHAEYKWRTLCTLALLPRSTISLCYSKLAGCLLALTPYVLWLGLSVWLFPVASLSDRPWTEIKLLLIVGACLLAVLSHLTAALSLVVKWGALPLAITILMMLSSCASPFVAAAASMSWLVTDEPMAIVTPVLYLTFLITAAMQIVIGLRFQRAAAD